MHFSNLTTPSEESQNFAFFTNELYFSEILKMINTNEIGSKLKTKMDELETFTCYLLVCSYYAFSPETMWDDRIGFPHFTIAIADLGGIDKFKHILKMSQISKNENKSYLG